MYTDSREAVLLRGWQAEADRRAGACVPGQRAGCEDLARQLPDDRRRPEDRPCGSPDQGSVDDGLDPHRASDFLT